MSQENVEIVRRSYEAFERGDLEEVRNSIDPEGRLLACPHNAWGKGTRLDMVLHQDAGTRSRRAARQTVEQLATWVDPSRRDVTVSWTLL
jgi:ketosteroid isomerase-like protein